MVIKYLKEIGLVHYIYTRSTNDKERHTTENQEKWKTCKDDTMTTTVNKFGDRKEKGKQDLETEGKTDWTMKYVSSFLFFILHF
jgi:hypothetical protein